ncbi:MAG TPA: type IV pilus modification protein PilV [Steroidobacter sp.]
MTHKAPTRVRGFTIAEILVALLVITVGIVGIAALYADRVHKEPETRYQELAAELAEDMAARIRVTKEGTAGFATTIGVLCDPKAEPKLPHDRAALQAACWEDEVERSLPSGLGTITRDLSTAPPTYVIAVSWSAPGQGAASYVVRVTPE